MFQHSNHPQICSEILIVEVDQGSFRDKEEQMYLEQLLENLDVLEQVLIVILGLSFLLKPYFL